MVTLKFAKLPCAGSIPVHASRLFQVIDQLNCPSGGIGRRPRLKIEYRKVCGFESRLGHKLFFSDRNINKIVPPIAQLVEQSPLKRTVVGSSPTRRTSE